MYIWVLDRRGGGLFVELAGNFRCRPISGNRVFRGWGMLYLFEKEKGFLERYGLRWARNHIFAKSVAIVGRC